MCTYGDTCHPGPTPMSVSSPHITAPTLTAPFSFGAKSNIAPGYIANICARCVTPDGKVFENEFEFT